MNLADARNVYNPPTRMGNWYEDFCLEEDRMKDFLYKKGKGQLLMQKRAFVCEKILKKVHLTVVNDGLIHVGDVIQLRCPGDNNLTCTGKCRQDSVLAAHCSLDVIWQNAKLSEPCKVTGCCDLVPNVRSSFVITSCDGTPKGEPLRYTQPFYLMTTDKSGGNLYLKSDKSTFTDSSYRTHHQEVLLVEKPSFLAEWRVVYFNPLMRLEYEYMPVSANVRVIVNHVYTNRNLCVEDRVRLIVTNFGCEYEVTAHTYLDSHKAEEPQNHWVIVTAAPGEPIIMPSSEIKQIEDVENNSKDTLKDSICPETICTGTLSQEGVCQKTVKNT